MHLKHEEVKGLRENIGGSRKRQIQVKTSLTSAATSVMLLSRFKYMHLFPSPG